MPTDIYQYNTKYDVYEDMSGNDTYMNDLYEKAVSLKIVGVVTTKEGVTSSSLNPGVNYTFDLIHLYNLVLIGNLFHHIRI